MRRSTSPLSVPDARRFRDVLAHIDAHLDDDLSLERLSRVARASTFHFHHQFSAQFGLAVHRYVTLARLRRAAYQLVFRQRLRIVDVALASGYESPEAFARAFKKVVGNTPSAFRAQPDWPAWRGWVGGARDGWGARPHAVTFEHVAPIRVAALELRGHPIRLGEALQRFIAWRVENKLPPGRSETYSIFHDPSERTAIDLCASTHRAVLPNTLGVIEKSLPAGRYAVLQHVGTSGMLFETVRSLYAEWLPASGETIRDAPLVIRRISLFPDVVEHEAESEIFLPVR
jgi:AraC family transcriptional regulator